MDGYNSVVHSESHCLWYKHRQKLCIILQIHALLASTLLCGQSFVSLRRALVLVLESTNEVKDKFSENKIMAEKSRSNIVMKEGGNQILVNTHTQNTAPLWKVISHITGGSAVSLKWFLHDNALTS